MKNDTRYELHLGDCLESLKNMPDNSVDSVITDPPYGLSKHSQQEVIDCLSAWLRGEEYTPKGKKGFMGKSWDAWVPSPTVWRECLRVLKPGGHLLAFAGTRSMDLMSMSVRLAGFELRDSIGYAHDGGGAPLLAWVYGCYSEDTQCLTKEGWKDYTNLSKDDFVLQWDSVADSFSWCNPEEIYIYDAPKSMVRFKNRHTDQLLTGNHRVYLKYKTNNRYEYGDYSVVNASDVKASWSKVFPLASKLLSGKNVKDTYLIGWWMTDSWVHGDGKACMFSQSKPKTLEKLKNALEKAICSFSEYTKTPKKENNNVEHTFYVTGNLADYLLSEFKDRKITYDVLTWDYDSRFDLLEGLLDGDGSRKEEQHSEVFWSKDNERLDVVSSLCTSLGIRNHVDYEKGCVYLNRTKNTTELQRKHSVETVDYDGDKVWCLKTKTGAFVVRRNGKPFISGNSGFPKSHDVSKAIDKAAGVEGGKGAVTGKSGSTRNSMAGDFAGGEYHEYLPATESAKQWQGWGSSMKPAWEPIILARKPLDGTIAENVLKHGTGALNIDGCRVGDNAGWSYPNGRGGSGWHGRDSLANNLTEPMKATQGRWPANLIHDGSEEVMAGFPSVKTGVCPAHASGTNTIYGDFSKRKHHGSAMNGGDSGSAARFFYCAKASKKDRNDGCDGLDTKRGGVLNIRTDSHSQANGMDTGPRANHHPTVKPTDLMRYLCRLVTPPNGTVLDPFTGSGSTGKAAILEGFNFIGCEMQPDYHAIAKARIEHAMKANSDSST